MVGLIYSHLSSYFRTVLFILTLDNIAKFCLSCSALHFSKPHTFWVAAFFEYHEYVGHRVLVGLDSLIPTPSICSPTAGKGGITAVHFSADTSTFLMIVVDGWVGCIGLTGNGTPYSHLIL